MKKKNSFLGFKSIHSQLIDNVKQHDFIKAFFKKIFSLIMGDPLEHGTARVIENEFSEMLFLANLFLNASYTLVSMKMVRVIVFLNLNE